MRKVKLIQVVDSKYQDLSCGACASVLYGYDEVICPVCGAFNDMDNPVQMTNEQVLTFMASLPA